jgi:hypothetical protein
MTAIKPLYGIWLAPFGGFVVRDWSTIRRPLWVIVPMALGLTLCPTTPLWAQVAPRESSSRIVHRFPPLPDIVQRKADVEARRLRTGILTKMLTKTPKNVPFLEIDVNPKVKQPHPAEMSKEVLAPVAPATTAPADTTLKTASADRGIVQVNHEEEAESSTDSEHMPTLPEAEPASEPIIPQPAVPTLRSETKISDTPEPADVQDKTKTMAGPELPPSSLPVTGKSMIAPPMRRDLKRTPPTARKAEPSTEPTSAGSLPRTLPEMDAPPIREAISAEAADKAKKELEQKLLSIAGPKPVLPSEGPSIPSQNKVELPTKQGSADDDMALVRQELGRLARPIPVEDPSLELAAEELKQLAASAGDSSVVMPASNPAPPAAPGPGLHFARENMGKESPSIPKPVPTQPSPVVEEKKPTEIPAPNPASPKPGPAPSSKGADFSLPPVKLDGMIKKEEPAPPKASTEKPAPAKEPTSKKDVSPLSEPPLKLIPPAAEVKTPAPQPVLDQKPTAIAATEPGSKGPTTGSAPIPRLRREGSPLPQPAKVEVVKTPPAAAPAKKEEVASTEKPTPKATAPIELELPKHPTAKMEKATPPSWRPLMPERKKNAVRPSHTEDEIVPAVSFEGSSKQEIQAKLEMPAEEGEAKPSGKPRMLAPIESDDLGGTSTRSILMPQGEKPIRSDFSRTMAARSMETLHSSKARTARERALADLARMADWYKAAGAAEAIKQVAMADDRQLMRQAAVEVLSSIPATEKEIDWILQDIAASNSDATIRQQAREALSARRKNPAPH